MPFGYYPTAPLSIQLGSQPLDANHSMERKRVNSSKVRAAGYDPKSQLLEIESFFEDKIDESFPSTRLK